MLTMRTRYALVALARLSERPGAPVLIAELAERGNIPRKFLESILRELKRRGLLKSQRGRGGGYSLSRPAHEISLSSIIQALDGALVPVSCVTRPDQRRCDACREGGVCGVRLVLSDLHEATSRILEKTTLADLMRRTRQAHDETLARRAS